MKPNPDFSTQPQPPLRLRRQRSTAIRRLFLRRSAAAGNSLPYRAARAVQADSLGRMGNLEVRLAVTRKDLHAVQKLRYQVFYKELLAEADAMTRVRRRDADSFDAICDHLLVLDHDIRERRKPKVVGTYRLLRQEAAMQHGGFYSQNEFDLEGLFAAHPVEFRFLELGRSCVLKPYRNRRTLELLWQGIWAYANRHAIDAMFGCASFAGVNPDEHALGLSFLHHYARADADWLMRAHPHLRQEMNLMQRGSIDPKAALRALPPLIKGYLRVGAKIGDGAVIDRQFGTIDVAVVMPMARINKRYLSHFGGRSVQTPAPATALAPAAAMMPQVN